MYLIENMCKLIDVAERVPGERRNCGMSVNCIEWKESLLFE